MPRSVRNRKKTSTLGDIRIIAGTWRSRKIQVLTSEGLRPTTNRVKETVFNWLQPNLLEANVLDLFAGSGSLGLEALSRGASHCHFIEKMPTVFSLLQQNIQQLQAQQQAQTLHSDALLWLTQPASEAFDIVLIDPPFLQELHAQCFELLMQQNWLKPGCLIYVESHYRTNLQFPEHWQLLKEKKAGQVCSRLLRFNSPNLS